MSRVDLGGFRLNTQVDGPEGAPWIVLSNSLGTNLSMWDAQVPLLTRKYRLLRYDKRGHGASDAPPGPYDFGMLGRDAIALMDHHGIETAVWLGLSMGAMTGMGLALTHPHRFSRMVLADARADMPPENRPMWDDRIAAVGAKGLEAVVVGSLAMWVADDWRRANPDRLIGLSEMLTANDPKGYIACCQAVRGVDYLKDLGKVSLPVLYVVGGADKGAPPAVMRAMADATPGASLVEIPGSGHIPTFDAPDAFNAAIAPFLGID